MSDNTIDVKDKTAPTSAKKSRKKRKSTFADRNDGLMNDGTSHGLKEKDQASTGGGVVVPIASFDPAEYWASLIEKAKSCESPTIVGWKGYEALLREYISRQDSHDLIPVEEMIVQKPWRFLDEYNKKVHDEKGREISLLERVDCLGTDEGYLYFSSFELGQVIDMKITLTLGFLYMLEKKSWWDNVYCTFIVRSCRVEKVEVLTLVRDRFRLAEVDSHLKEISRRKIYSQLDVRGRGHWRDKNDLVLHTGNRLIVNGSSISMHEYNRNSRYFYMRMKTLVYVNEVSSQHEFIELFDAVKNLYWARKGSAALIMGWGLLAPFAGAVRQRPTLSLGGEHGSGKSSLLANLLDAVIHPDYLLSTLGGSTDPGLRQSQSSDCLPCLLDEAESEDTVSTRRNAAIKDNRRGSATEGRGRIHKGSASGRSMTYACHNMMCYMAINPASDSLANIARELSFDLQKRVPTPESIQIYQNAERVLESAIEDQRALRFHAFIRAHWSLLRDNIAVASSALKLHLIDTRQAGFYGHVIAIFDLLYRNGETLTSEQVLAWANEYQILDNLQNDHGNQSTAELFLEMLLMLKIKIQQVERTLEQWFLMLEEPYSPLWNLLKGDEERGADMTHENWENEVHSAIKSYGIGYITKAQKAIDPNTRGFVLKRNNALLKRYFKDTHYENWSKIVPRIDNVVTKPDGKRLSFKVNGFSTSENWPWYIPLPELPDTDNAPF